ncbi:hypothetical protein CEXT_431571 [Caerostris extrusa]|uniref:Uncharacterized protein n=1 Tax=Caerostris extrusa TaxID=172846 RepID=A0AAV4NAX2_CAEEX|nr:hypothetical protein CEXT_431571 [Caerostris extrusa]
MQIWERNSFLQNISVMNSFLVCLVLLSVAVACRADSSSMACSSGPDGAMNCEKASDPTGNKAGATALSDGDGGEVYAGARRSGAYNEHSDHF